MTFRLIIFSLFWIGMSTNVCFLSQLYAILRRIPTQNFALSYRNSWACVKRQVAGCRQKWSLELCCKKTRKKSALPTPSALVERKFVLASFLAIRRVFLPPPDRQSVELVEEVVLLVVILETDVTDIVPPRRVGVTFGSVAISVH